MTQQLHIARGLSLPIDFVTSTQVVLAQKGKGKSYTAAVQAEELLDAKQQIVVVDPTGAHWGLRSSPDGKSSGYSIAVLGGEHADVQLEATAGEVIAEAIATEHFSAIIDLTLFRKGEALRFMALFLETLYRKNRTPLHLFIDEADVVAPQKTFGPDQARVLGAAEDIVRRGRIRGIGCTLITQRPQVLNKDVLTQADMLTTLGMSHPKDLAAISAWVAVHGDPDKAKTMISSLPSLPRGDAWVWNPTIDLFKRVTIRERHTFDSGRTPKSGERKVDPKVLAPVDIARLGATIAATVERQKANDPAALKRRVAELEKQVTKAKPAIATPATTKVDTKVVEKPAIRPAELKRLEHAFEKMKATQDRAEKTTQEAIEKIEAVYGKLDDQFDGVQETLREINRRLGAMNVVVAPSSPQTGRQANVRVVPPAQPVTTSKLAGYERRVTGVAAGETAPSKAERAMLIALAERPDGLTRKKIRIYTGYADSGPTSKAMTRLLAEGWATENSGRLAITELGLQVLGDWQPLPKGDELRALLLNGSRLSKPEKAMLAVLCEAYPNRLTRAEIRERTGYADSGPTSKAFSHLVGLDYVIDEGRSGLCAAEELFG